MADGEDPADDQRKQAAKSLIKQAVKPSYNLAFRNHLREAKQQSGQVIYTIIIEEV
ncbi:MAG: hypothetical protein AAF800_00900 [Planctomycetota bacterium]